jgi:hypothetical protein
MATRHQINLIAACANREAVSGPAKFFRNLAKGLQRNGQRFCVNQGLESTRWLWIHDDLRALLEVGRGRTLNLLGPCLAMLPRDLLGRHDFPRSYYLQSGPWTTQLWEQEGFSGCPLRSFAVGIDTDELPERPPLSRKPPVLLYYKHRSPWELAKVEKTLREKGIEFHTLVYGAYKQHEYLRFLQTHAYVVWLGCSEGQGLAMGEALAMNVPLLVIDACSLFDTYPLSYAFPQRLKSFRTTSAPYFDSRCGIVIDNWQSLSPALDKMQDSWRDFQPREFVRENLSLELQASRFVNFFEELETQYGATVALLPDGRPHNPYRPTTLSKVRVRAHGLISRYSRWTFALLRSEERSARQIRTAETSSTDIVSPR